MPIISMFYGIIIQMYFFDTDKHNVPHIHARYAEHNVSIAIETGEILAGYLPNRQLKLVVAWVEIHQEELFADWTLATEGETLFKIEPLR